MIGAEGGPRSIRRDASELPSAGRHRVQRAYPPHGVRLSGRALRSQPFRFGLGLFLGLSSLRLPHLCLLGSLCAADARVKKTDTGRQCAGDQPRRWLRHGCILSHLVSLAIAIVESQSMIVVPDDDAVAHEDVVLDGPQSLHMRSDRLILELALGPGDEQ